MDVPGASTWRSMWGPVSRFPPSFRKWGAHLLVSVAARDGTSIGSAFEIWRGSQGAAPGLPLVRAGTENGGRTVILGRRMLYEDLVGVHCMRCAAGPVDV